MICIKKNIASYTWQTLAGLFWILTQFQAHSQTSVRPINGPRSEKHLTDELGRRQGVWKYYYANGDLREEINYVNNLQEGVDTKYYQGTKPQIESNYLNGIKDGDYKRYFLSGQAAIEGKYIYGQREGIWTEYYEDGQTKSTREYKKGIKEGNWKLYNRKGELLSDVTYKNGVNTSAPPPSPKEKPALNKKNPANPKDYKVKGATSDTTKLK